MTFIEICKQGSTVGLQVIRPKKDGAPNEYDAKPWPGGNKRGWTLLDAYSASAVTQVHEALNDTNKAKLEALPAELAYLLRKNALCHLIEVRETHLTRINKYKFYRGE